MALELSCPKRPRSFFFGLVQYLDAHDNKLLSLERNKEQRGYWIVRVKCRTCGLGVTRADVRTYELLSAGVKPASVKEEDTDCCPEEDDEISELKEIS
ncbi:MAG: hypothetical protein L0Y56_06285 [Nitrospira sp.]|nr:hypothetical protein [Nitrospira sp.]